MGWGQQFVVEDSCRIKLRMVYGRVQVHVDRSVFALNIVLFLKILATILLWIAYGKVKDKGK